VHRPVFDQGLDHGARTAAVDVRDQHVEPDARIHQHLVQAVFLGAAHAHELLPLPRHQAQ
jgi:hypothetical protein